MSAEKRSSRPLQIVSPMHKGMRQISEHLIHKMGEIGAPGWESHLLSYVGVYGTCQVGELRRVFGYQPSTLTSVLDRLESEGLINRQPNRQDRRSFLIAVTAKGRRVGRQARKAVEEFEAQILERVEIEDLAGFRQVMAAVAEVTEVQLREEEKA